MQHPLVRRKSMNAQKYHHSQLAIHHSQYNPGKLFGWYYLHLYCNHHYSINYTMKLQEELIKRLSKTYEPSTMIDMRFKEKDIAFKTDEQGNPILLFIGKRGEEGTIKGERYARTLKYDKEGKKIKDHWELKG